MISDRVQRRMRRTVVSAHRQWLRGVAPEASPSPVFVVGSQRSGTTMVMRVFELSAHATVFTESNPSAFGSDLLLRDTEHVQGLIREAKTDVVVFKPMNELQRAQQWLADYPGVRVVWLVRRYEDVVSSCVRKFTGIREILGKLVENPEQAGWRGEGLSGEKRELIRAHYRPDMTLADGHALFWVIRNAHYFELGLEEVPQVRLFSYEALVGAPHQHVEALFQFVGCPFHRRVTREIHSSSVGRNEAPDLDPAIEALCDDMQQRLDHAVRQSS